MDGLTYFEVCGHYRKGRQRYLVRSVWGNPYLPIYWCLEDKRHRERTFATAEAAERVAAKLNLQAVCLAYAREAAAYLRQYFADAYLRRGFIYKGLVSDLLRRDPFGLFTAELPLEMVLTWRGRK